MQLIYFNFLFLLRLLGLFASSLIYTLYCMITTRLVAVLLCMLQSMYACMSCESHVCSQALRGCFLLHEYKFRIIIGI